MNLRTDQITLYRQIVSHWNEGILVGAPPGFGKGFVMAEIVAAEMRHPQPKGIWIVCPASQISEWVNEFDKVHVTYQRIEHRSSYSYWQAHRERIVGIISVDKLVKFIMSSLHLVVFDETIKFLNYKSKRSKHGYHLARKADKVVGLNGTPLEGLKPLQIWTQSKIVHRGNIFGYRASDYYFKYDTPLWQIKTATRMIDKMLQISGLVLCDFTKTVNSVFKKISPTLNTMTRLNVLEEEYKYDEELIENVPVMYLRQLQECGTDTNKLLTCINLLDTIPRAIIVAKFNEELEMLHELIQEEQPKAKIQLVTGSLTKKKQQAIEEGKPDYVFLQTRLGVGTNCFKHYDTMIFYGHPYEPYFFEQNIGRMTRESGKQVTVYHLYLGGTYDEKSMKKMLKTQKVIEGYYND